MKKSFILYSDQKEIIDALSDDMAGKLIKAIFDYVRGDNPDVGSKLLPVFISFKQTIDRDKQKWENIVKRNQENIKKRYEKLPKTTKSTTGRTGIPNAVDSVSVSVSDSDNNNSAEKTYLSQHAIWEIASKNNCDVSEVLKTYWNVIDPDNRKTYKIKNTRQTLNNWVSRGVSKGTIQTTTDFAALEVLKFQEPKPEKANLLVKPEK